MAPIRFSPITLLDQPSQSFTGQIAGRHFIPDYLTRFRIDVLPFVRVHDLEMHGAISHGAERIVLTEYQQTCHLCPFASIAVSSISLPGSNRSI